MRARIIARLDGEGSVGCGYRGTSIHEMNIKQTYNTIKTRDMAMGDRRDALSGGGAHVLDAKLKLVCMGCTKRGGGW